LGSELFHCFFLEIRYFTVMTPEILILGLAWYLVFVVSLTFHEAAHAFIAHRLGDSTAYNSGQVSLDPTPHIRREPIGMVVLPIISFLANGWMIGWASTPYDPNWARRYPKREILMAVAGPAANLILVIIAALLIRLGMLFDIFYPPETITFSHVVDVIREGRALAGIGVIVSILFTLNLVLFVFNLLPIPPLDGSALVPLFLSEQNANLYKQLITRPAFSIIGLIIAWQLFGFLFAPIHTLALNLLFPGWHYS